MSEQELYGRIARLEYLVKNLYEHQNVTLPSQEQQAQLGTLSVEVQQFMAQGDSIGAIKQFRAETGADLATAKAAILGT